MADNQRLMEDEIQQLCLNVPEWEMEGKYISRRYRFNTFQEAVAFVNQVAVVAEENNHHPFISIDYKFVTLRLTSWHAGGLTSLDFFLANELDRRYEHSFPSNSMD